MNRPFFRARLRVLRVWRAVSGWRVYLLALMLALPDILDALGAVDLTPLLPAWLPGAKAAAALAVARLVARAYAAKLTTMAPPPGGGR